LKRNWCIPPKADAAFVAAMEDVLDIYCMPYNKSVPVINMDEQPYQRLDHTRELLPMKPGEIERVDYEYERCGTASIFLFTETLGNWRKVSVRERRTAVDWAEEIKMLLEIDYPDAEKIILICDNLNTHSINSLYKAFPPAKARELAKKLEIHHTPKHGSWLNIAECELSVLTRQCLKRRIPKIENLRDLAQKWEKRRNSEQKGICWQFKTEDARIKLRNVYPHIQM